MRVTLLLVLAPAALAVAASSLFVAPPIPTEVQLPGTQPFEPTNLGAATQCDNCHGDYDAAVEPSHNWRGSMMAHAGRDPLYWATVAVAEQSFPGVGDLCIRCHAPRGWTEGRSSPTDGSALTNADSDGVECAICHKLVNPDDSEHVGVQNAPFLAHDGGNPPQGYYGNGMYVIWNGNERLGPYDDASVAPHVYAQSQFHRQPEFCGTCHDVSNPVTGDLAHNNGAQVPLAPGTFSGTLGTPVETKAAFNNFPYQYGVVERTFSEFKASAWDTTLVSSYASLPADLKAGAVQDARQAALVAGTSGNYADGTLRYFSCQTCHVPPVVGKGCDRNNAPVRQDLPHHDMTGGNYWMPDLIQYLDGQNALVLGGNLTNDEVAGLNAGKQRARDQLDKAAALSVSGNTVKIVNLTGHKLISGYPEGRRMWLHVEWYDASSQLLREDGAYGTMSVQIDGTPTPVETILDLAGANTRIYQAKYGLTQEWASQLMAPPLNAPANLPIAYDRTTGAVSRTLGQLAAQPPGTYHESFNFALNNFVIHDNRIPPYGFAYDEARVRNALPVPENQYGDPGVGGTYRYWDEVTLNPPAGAVSAEIELLYQPTSWEYVQFLYLANDGQNPTLGQTGADLLQGWLQTGMAEPHEMVSATWTASFTASATNLGTGCGGTAQGPMLTITPPVLGQSTTISVSGATPQAAGSLLYSLPPAASLPLGSGCEVFIDLVTNFELFPVVTDASGDWTVTLPLPNEPALAGLQLVFQTVLYGTSGPFGVDLTNGVEIVLGY